MNRDATIDRVDQLTPGAAQDGPQLVVFPEAFVPGTPIWIDTRPIWDGDDDWFGIVPASFVDEHGPWIEPGNTVIVGPDGALVCRTCPGGRNDAGRRARPRQGGGRSPVHGPTGHYNRPDIFRLLVDTTSRQASTATGTSSPYDGQDSHAVP